MRTEKEIIDEMRGFIEFKKDLIKRNKRKDDVNIKEVISLFETKIKTLEWVLERDRRDLFSQEFLKGS